MRNEKLEIERKIETQFPNIYLDLILFGRRKKKNSVFFDSKMLLFRRSHTSRFEFEDFKMNHKFLFKTDIRFHFSLIEQLSNKP
jgi:hypothetical protein